MKRLILVIVLGLVLVLNPGTGFAGNGNGPGDGSGTCDGSGKGPNDGPGSGPGNGTGNGTGPGNGTGNGQGQNGTGCWWGDPALLLDGEPYNLEGSLLSLGYTSQGGGGGVMVLETDQGRISIYGTGPYWYWQDLGVEWPSAGDVIGAEGYLAVQDGLGMNIAFGLTVNGIYVPLRDPETGLPLWWVD